MSNLQSSLSVRRSEFEMHFLLAQTLENRMILNGDIDDVALTVRHINALKSGLIVHLYNIEEAIMNEAIQLLGVAIGSSDPQQWSEHSLREWLREAVVSRTADGNEEGRLSTVFKSSKLLLNQAPLGPQILKKPSGTWDDKKIAAFAQRMNVTFELPPQMWVRIRKDARYNDMTPIQFLADRRNAIAHGRRSFENGAYDLLLGDIRVLADTTIDYLSHAADAFQKHVENGSYLKTVA